GSSWCRRCGVSALVVRARELDRVVLPAGVEIHDLARHTGQDRRDRIDAQHWLTGGADDLISHAEQALVAAAAHPAAKHRDLAEHIVQPVHRNDGPAHAHLVGQIVYRAFNGEPYGGTLDDALPDRKLAALPGELGAQGGEGDAVRQASRSARGRAIERGLTFHREVSNVEQPLLRTRVGRRRLDRERHLAADHLGVYVIEAEERAGVI